MPRPAIRPGLALRGGLARPGGLVRRGGLARRRSGRLVGRRPGRLVGVLALALLAGCGSVGASTHPTWVPQPAPSAIGLPTPAPPGAGDPSPGGSPPGSTSAPGAPKKDPNVVATGLSAPTGLALLPDGTALVGERTTGRIVIVAPTPGHPVRVVRTLTGLSTVGGGGLLDLALSGSYREDGLIMALITTAHDTRVVQFTLRGTVTAVLTGIPRGSSDNVGRLLVQPDGSILVGTGDAGKPARAANPRNRGGKVLRMDELGHPAAGNPRPGSLVFTSGHRTVNGLCADSATGVVLEVEAGATDELNVLHAGASYGWPGGGGTAPVLLPSRVGGVGDCAIAKGNLYVTGLGGRDVFQTRLTGAGQVGLFTAVLNNRYGRLLSVVAGPDGSLWVTTSNRDGHGRPVAADERVLHFTPAGGGGDSPV